LDEELRYHLDRQIEENLARGMSAHEARYAALRAMGGIEQQKERCRDTRRVSLIEDLARDLRYAVRVLAKSPVFTAVSVLTLALGVGANTAIFSVVNAALLRPLPYDATRLVAVESFNPQKESQARGVSPADYWDWKEQSRTLEQLTAYSGGGIGLKESERVEVIPGAGVATNFFETFGVQPMLGRSFVGEEGFLNGPKVVILSHRLWQRRFGGDPQIVNRLIKTDEGDVTVVGVMPPDFNYPKFAEAWTPMARDTVQMKYRASRYFRAIGRIKQGETIQSAQEEMETIAARLAEAYPRDNQGWTVRVTDWRGSLVRDSREALLILMGAVLCVLLIACTNVANLLLARATSRRKEMAIRLALGASRRALLRQLLVESLMLGLAGGALGVLLAIWGVEALVQSLPELNFTFQALSELRSEISIDWAVLLFALVASLLTGLGFGLVPAWQAAKTDVNESLKEGGRGPIGVGTQRARRALVVSEIAMAVVLLVGAWLMMTSFSRLLRVDPGYDPHGLMAMPLSFPEQNKYAFARQVMERVLATPGVRSAALMSYPTLGGLNFPFNREDKPLPDGDVTVAYSAISPTYFRTLRTPLRAGREFADQDHADATGVAIINESMARQYFAGEDPIGRRIILNYLNKRLTREIVGVVGDIKQEEPSKPTKPEIYVPFAQLPWFSGTLVVRSEGPDPLMVRGDVQQAIWSFSPGLPESKAEPFTKTLAGQVAEPRLYALLLSIFAAIALVLAAIGIYGVMAYTVTQRTQEIGIRMALGASPTNVLKLVIGQGMRLIVIGVMTGLIGALALTRLIRSLLFGVSTADPVTYCGVAVILVLAALLACWIPARRATKVDPMTALRSE
jgi:putative ABC transport system permease protein